MLSLQRSTNEFNAIFRLLSRRHGIILLILMLWIVYKHFIFFILGHATPLLGNQHAVDSIASPDFIFLLISIIVSLDVFAKLRSSVGGTHYLMTPANTSDKFAAAWLYSTLVTFISITIVYNLTHLLCMAIGNVIYGANLEVHFQSWSAIFKLFSGVMFIQSIYFLGSVFFKKNPAGTTTLILFAVSLIIGITATFIFTHYIKSSFGVNIFNFKSANDWNLLFNRDAPEYLKTLYNIAKVIYYTTPFICWGGAYLVLKNKEV
jgi:hypothetical protein